MTAIQSAMPRASDGPLGLGLDDFHLLAEKETGEGSDDHAHGTDEVLVKLFALRDKDEAEEKDDESEEILHAETLFGVGDGAFPGNFDGTLALGLRVKGSHRVGEGVRVTAQKKAENIDA